MALRVGLEHPGHAGEVSLAGGPEELEGLGIEAQMHVSLAGRLRLHDPRTVPERLVQLQLGRISRGRLRQTVRPQLLDLVERRSPDIVVCHSLLPSRR